MKLERIPNAEILEIDTIKKTIVYRTINTYDRDDNPIYDTDAYGDPMLYSTDYLEELEEKLISAIKEQETISLLLEDGKIKEL